MFLIASFCYSPEVAYIEFRYIGAETIISIPKVSMLVAALRDLDSGEESIWPEEDYASLDKVGTEILGADPTYRQPRILNFSEGITVDKESFIMGRYRALGEEDPFIIAKSDAKSLENYKSIDLMDSQELTNENFVALVQREDRKNFINSKFDHLTNGQQNRLNALEYSDLENLAEIADSKDEDPLLEQIRKAVDSYSVTTLNNPTGKSSGSNIQVGSSSAGKSRSMPSSKNRENSSGENIGPGFSVAGLLMKASSKDESIYGNSGYSYESIEIPLENPEQQSEYSFRAKFLFDGGLAYLGPESEIRISLVSPSSNKIAEIDVSQGEFEILADVEKASLVGEYFDPQGRLIGFNSQDYDKSNWKEGQSFKILPLEWGLSIAQEEKAKGEKIIYSLDGQEEVVSEEGFYFDEAYTYYSNFYLQSLIGGGKDQYQMIGANAKDQPVRRMETEYLEEFSDYLRDQGIYIDPNLPVVSGTISGLLKPSGFQVEITDTKAIGPIYLNGFLLPDLDAKETSLSGRFFFFNVAPGNHQVRVRSNDKISAQILMANPSSVSHIEFPMDEWKELFVSVKDQKTEQNIAGVFQWAGTEDVFQGENLNRIKIRYLKNKPLQNLEFFAGDNYYPTRWSFSDRKNWVGGKNLLLFAKENLPKLSLDKKSAVLIDLSNRVEQILINHQEISSGTKLYVFDGKLWKKYSGDGFGNYEFALLYGLDPGLHSAQFQISSTGLISNQLFASDIGVLSLIEP